MPPTLTEIQRISRRLASAEARTEKIRAERDAAIVAAHAGGESPKLIAVAAGISEMTVFKILRQARTTEDNDG
jgi:DNA-binding CsgD family transcriptional regulator